MELIKRLKSKLTLRIVIIGACLVLVGFLLAFSLRFMLVQKPGVHYHANFEVYINDQRFLFDNFSYYEEIQACNGEGLNNPKSRVHLHNNVANIVHVHDYAVTWGHLFENLDVVATSKVLQIDGKTYLQNEDSGIKYLLNGQEISNPSQYVIKSEDKLLIHYTTKSDNSTKNKYDSMKADASEFNQKHDPSACTGSNNEPFWDRFKRTIGINSVH